MKVRGHKDIALEFYGLIKAFKDVKLEQKSLTVTEGSRPGVYEASVANTQHYVTERSSWLSKRLMPEKLQIEVRSKADFTCRLQCRTYERCESQQTWSQQD